MSRQTGEDTTAGASISQGGETRHGRNLQSPLHRVTIAPAEIFKPFHSSQRGTNMRRFITLTLTLAFVFLLTVSSASAALHRVHRARSYAKPASYRYQYYRISAPWYLDRVDPLLEEQDWYSR